MEMGGQKEDGGEDAYSENSSASSGACSWNSSSWHLLGKNKSADSEKTTALKKGKQ